MSATSTIESRKKFLYANTDSIKDLNCYLESLLKKQINVGLELPTSVFSVSGSPVTDSGVLVGSFINQNPNLAFLSPDGIPGVPTFRALLPSDIPPLPYVTTSTQLKTGGIITWVSGYTYDVSPATYDINGLPYSSPYTQITLAAADPIFDRIDVVAVDTSGNVVVLTGIPGDDPLPPSVDPATQMELKFILVTANTVAPVVPQEWIYRENIEWTAASSSIRIVSNSITNPAAGILSIEATAAQNADFMTLTAPAPPVMSTYNILTFKLTSKAFLPATSSINIRFYNGATPIGNNISITDGTYGFNSNDLVTDQVISIPLVNFGVISTTTAVRITATTLSTLGFFIDEIQLQAGAIPTDTLFFRQNMNTFGTKGIFGLRDNFDLGVHTNNVERMLFKNTGNVLIGSNTDNGSLLQVNGTARALSLRMASLIMSESGATTTFNLQGFNLTTAYGANGTALHTFGNGVMSITRTANSKGGLIAGYAQTDAGMGALWVGNQLANNTYSPFVGTVNGYFIGTMGYVTTGESITANGIYGISLHFNNQATANNPNAAWFHTLKPPPAETNLFPWILKKTGQFIFGQYGINTFAGTPAYSLGVTATGEVIEFVGGGGGESTTANNGLTLTGSNVALGGTLLGTTLITAGVFTLQVLGTGSAASFDVQHSTGAGWAILGRNDGTGTGIEARSISGDAINALKTSTGVSDFVRVLQVTRATSGTALNNIGGFIGYSIETDSGIAVEVSRIGATLTTVADATRTSDLQFWTTNSATTAVRATIAGSGQFKLHNYGINAFTGTPAYSLAVTATGQLIEIAVGGGGEATTADNGLTLTGVNVRLGGPLLVNTDIDAGTFNLYFHGTNQYPLIVENTQLSGSGAAAYFQVTPTATSTVVPIVVFNRSVNGAGAGVGAGGSINIDLDTATSNATANQIISKWTTATHASRVSEWIITGVDNAVTADLLTIAGSGSARLHKYGTNIFTGTPFKLLAVDTNGFVLETALGGAGGGDALIANPLSQFAATTSLQLIGVMSDETGTDKLVFNTSPLFVTPRLAAASTIGHVWTATDTSGNGSFQAGGGGSQTPWTANVNADGFTLFGNDGSGESLTLASTSHATKGTINLGTSRYDEVNNRLGIQGTPGATALDIWSGVHPTMILGADLDLSTRTNVTNKFGCIAIPHYTNSEEPWCIFRASSSSATNICNFGLGTTGVNSATGFDFYTATNNTTISGAGVPRRMTMTSVKVWFNDPLGNFDFQISGDTDTNLFYVDASADGIGIGLATPSAKLHLAAGTATAGTAPLKFTTGTALTTPADGALEYHTSHLYFTIGSTRFQLDQQAGGGGATVALDNLAAVAINTSLISDTNNTDDLGSSSKGWKDVYAYTMKLNGSTSGTLTIQASAIAGTQTLTMPSTFVAGGALTDAAGNGTLTWVVPSGSGDMLLGSIQTVTGAKTFNAGKLILAGSTSGTVILNATAIAGTPTFTFPIVSGVVMQYVAGTTASSATPTPTGDARENFYDVTAQAAGATFGAPTGTAINHNKLRIRIKDNGVARSLAWNAIYRAGTDVALPTTTIINETLYADYDYNSADTKWDLVGVTQGFA